MKKSTNDVKKMQKLAGIITEGFQGDGDDDQGDGLSGFRGGGSSGRNQPPSNYKYMDNYELVDILTNIHDVYNNPDFIETEPKFVEAAKHIETAINLIKSRSGN